MSYNDIDPMDIDPETGRPYSNYSSPSIDTSFHDGEMDVDDVPRWSGFATQSKAWREGYEWENGRGPHADLDIFEAIEAHGYDLDSAEADQFEKGAEFTLGDKGYGGEG